VTWRFLWWVGARSLDVSGPDVEPSPQLDTEGLTELVERAINGVEHLVGHRLWRSTGRQVPARDPHGLAS
jgi:hypothetical protein